MTKDNLDELLELTLEMEGLISLMIKREDMTPPSVSSILGRKAARFNELIESVVTVAEPRPVASQQVVDLQPEIIAEPEETVEEHEIADAVELEQKEDAEPMAEEPQREHKPMDESVVANCPERKLVFTLNDRFRFRRNLFDGSDEEFNGTLKILGGMSSMDEVSDYLFNDLCLDADNPEVQAFVEALAPQFK
ncbi:MAG: hypothetical protein K2I18_07490 [Paramuribaculum sp.]|nr:hypothetical protein [Paramuribaculum sp.]